jgi:hypothetical protein
MARFAGGGAGSAILTNVVVGATYRVGVFFHDNAAWTNWSEPSSGSRSSILADLPTEFRSWREFPSPVEGDITNRVCVYDVAGIDRADLVYRFSDEPLPYLEMEMETTDGSNYEVVLPDPSRHVHAEYAFRVTDGIGRVSTYPADTFLGLETSRVETNELLVRGSVLRPEAEGITVVFDVRADGVQRERVTVEVYDLSGRVVRTLVRGEYATGRHRIRWTGDTGGPEGGGEPAASGIYFVRMRAGQSDLVRRVAIVR